MAKIWTIVGGFAVILGIIGGIYGVDANYVRRDYYKVCEDKTKADLDGVQAQIAGVQDQIMLQRAYDEVYFWQRTVVQLTQALAQSPNNGMLQVQLNNARIQLEAAEKRLRQLQQKGY